MLPVTLSLLGISSTTTAVLILPHMRGREREESVRTFQNTELAYVCFVFLTTMRANALVLAPFIIKVITMLTETLEL